MASIKLRRFVPTNEAFPHGIEGAAQETVTREGFEIIKMGEVTHSDRPAGWWVQLEVEPAFPDSTVPWCNICNAPSWKNGPKHYPSPNCESGKYIHCSCDVCF